MSTFDIILSKNRIARELKTLYKKLGKSVPEHIIFDFEEIEKETGTLNQPSASDIFKSEFDI